MRRLQANRTQDQLANEAGVTHDNVVRNEQGLFTNPSPAILSVITELSGDTTEQILKEYHAWVAHKRRSEPIRSLVKRQISFPNASTLNQHPFLLWRTAIAPGISRIAFCQMLCVHPATLLKYEKGDQRTMPSQIFEALSETGMEQKLIQNLAQLGSEYFTYECRRRTGAVV